MAFKNCSDNLDKAIQDMTQYIKVGRILDGININNNELLAAKSLVQMEHPANFITASNALSLQVTKIFQRRKEWLWA